MRDYWAGEILSLASAGELSANRQSSNGDAPATDRDHTQRSVDLPPELLALTAKLKRASLSPLDTAIRQFHRVTARSRQLQQLPIRWLLDVATGSTGSFEGWASTYLDSVDEHSVRSYINQLPYQPLISIVMPLYQPDLPILRETIRSVTNQIYPNWQLCIVDDHSDDHDLDGYLAHLSRQESRLDFLRREKSGGIAVASNDAIALAKGEYVCFLDQGDRLTPDALAWIVAAVVNNTEVELLYSDEDKTNSKERFDPYFKPDFDPLLLLGQNYLTRLLTIRRNLLVNLGGLRLGVDGAQDWDLALRATESIAPSHVVHIPKILYHWSIADDTILMALGIENDIYESGRKVVADALVRRSLKALAEPANDAAFKLLHFKPDPSSRVAIILSASAKNVANLVAQLDHPLIRRFCSDLVIINGPDSSPELRSYLASVESKGIATVVERKMNTSLAATYNDIASKLTTKYIYIIGDFVLAEDPSWLSELVGIADGMGLAIASPLLLSSDRKIYQAGLMLGVEGEAAPRYYGEPETATGHRERLTVAQQVSAVTTETVLINREIYLAVGGMDEYLGGLLRDLDLCLKLGAAGEAIGYTPTARLMRIASERNPSPPPPPDGEELVTFWDRWRPQLARDRYYNQNLITTNTSCAPTRPRVCEPWQDGEVIEEYPFYAPYRSLPTNPIVLSPGGHVVVHLATTVSYAQVTLWLQTSDSLPSIRLVNGETVVDHSFPTSPTQFSPIAIELDGTGNLEVINTSAQDIALEAYELVTTQLLRIHTARKADFLVDTLGMQVKTLSRKRSH